MKEEEEVKEEDNEEEADAEEGEEEEEEEENSAIELHFQVQNQSVGDRHIELTCKLGLLFVILDEKIF